MLEGPILDQSNTRNIIMIPDAAHEYERQRHNIRFFSPLLVPPIKQDMVVTRVITQGNMTMKKASDPYASNSVALEFIPWEN